MGKLLGEEGGVIAATPIIFRNKGISPPMGAPGPGRVCFPREQWSSVHRIAVLVPMGGSAGMWGPSCISCAQLAIDEVNAGDGVCGRPLEPLFLDSNDCGLAALEWEINNLIEDGVIAGIVGMSVSSVRKRLNEVVAGRVPHVYTPLYEGYEQSPNVFTIGETPGDQLVPAVRYLSEMLKVRRWALIGNDYVWPRTSNAIAKECIAANGGIVTFEGYVPLGVEEPFWLVERIGRTHPDIVLVSLVGQDAVEFNRCFGMMGLDRRIFRFSTAMEENVLMATGVACTKRLYAAAAYFSTLATDRNLAFKEHYQSRHRGAAPTLNSLGQSVYEGVSFYASLMRQRWEDAVGPVVYSSARGGIFYSNDRKEIPTYLARADGLQFAILDRLS